MRLQDVRAVVFAEEALDERQVLPGQDDVLETADGFAQRQQGDAALAVFGDGFGEAAQRRRGRRAGAPAEDSLQIVGEQAMPLLALLGNDLSARRRGRRLVSRF